MSVLNPSLFSALESCFGHVTIVNHGASRYVRYSVDLARPGCYRSRQAEGGEQYRVNCPFCHDTRQRCYVNHAYGVLDPKTKSRNYHLLYCHNEQCHQDPANRDEFRYKVERRKGCSSPMAPAGVQVSERHSVAREACLPGPVEPLHELHPGHHAVWYVRQRGFDPGVLGRNLGVSYCPRSMEVTPAQAGDRLIVPVHFDGKLVGWQARLIECRRLARDDDDDDFYVPRYFTMPGFTPSGFLYNFDNARRYGTVYVCEGVTDVWRVGPQGVALFGKTASRRQVDHLAQTWKDGVVVILLDADARKDAERLREKLAPMVRKVMNVVLDPGKDPGDCEREALQRKIAEAATAQGVNLSSPGVSVPGS